MTKCYFCGKEKEIVFQTRTGFAVCKDCEKDQRTCDECGCECVSCRCTTYGGCDDCGCGKGV